MHLATSFTITLRNLLPFYLIVKTFASNDQPDMFSDFYRKSKGQIISPRSFSMPSHTLLQCVVKGKANEECFAINFSRQGLCRLQLEDGNRQDGAADRVDGDWVSVVLRTVQPQLVNYTTGHMRNQETTSATTGCPSPSVGEFGGKCYRLIEDPLPMFTAVRRCQEEGMELVSIETEAEQAFLCTVFAGSGELWSGGTFDRGVPYWSATSQDMTYVNWDGGSLPPDTADSSVYFDFTRPGCPWIVHAFTAPKPFICEGSSNT